VYHRDVGKRRDDVSDDTGATPLLRPLDEEAVGPKRPCLIVIAGPRLGEIFPIDGEVIIGRDFDTSLSLSDDEGVSRRHARVTATDDGALITDLESANGLFVDGARVREQLLTDGAKVRVGQTTVLKFARFDSVEELAQRQLLEAALRDGMTRAFNRRYFLQRLVAEVRFADRHQKPLALLLLDIDLFKELNDRLGHPVGDQLLIELVARLGKALRAEDVLARYGGEEFAVLARGINDEQALQLGERLRQLVEEADFGRDDVKLTISVGLATFPFEGAEVDTAAERLVERADAALYRAKQAGRNQVCR
jgi:diguanylate cyclase (GGDEF)-like protein